MSECRWLEEGGRAHFMTRRFDRTPEGGPSSPGYDVSYSYNPNGAWTSRHQMSLVGKRDGFTGDDLLAAAPAANLKARQAKGILEEVRAAVSEWQRIAVEAGVTEKQAGAIARTHRMM